MPSSSRSISAELAVCQGSCEPGCMKNNRATNTIVRRGGQPHSAHWIHAPFPSAVPMVRILVVLLRFDPAKSSTISVALWVPVIWIFIIGSRLPSQWLSWGMTTVSAALEEGNPVDRTINSALILLAIGILVSRSFNWETFISRNLALAAFLFFRSGERCVVRLPLYSI